MKILLFIMIVSFLKADDYKGLKTYKSEHPSAIQENRKGKIIVKFRDINNFNFYKFEKKYDLELSFCVANSVCAFKVLDMNRFREVLIEIKKEKSLKWTEVYTDYNMKIY